MLLTPVHCPLAPQGTSGEAEGRGYPSPDCSKAAEIWGWVQSESIGGTTPDSTELPMPLLLVPRRRRPRVR